MESQLLHFLLAHQRQEVTALRGHSTLVADLALEAQPSRGCDLYFQAHLPFRAVVLTTFVSGKAFENLTKIMNLLPRKTHILT